MVRRSPARWIAPLALAAAVLAVLLVVNSDTGGHSSGGSAGTVTSSSTATTHTATTVTPRHNAKSYVVKPGDTLSAIAAKTAVPLAQITRLNPHVDAQTLTVGQRLKLAP